MVSWISVMKIMLVVVFLAIILYAAYANLFCLSGVLFGGGFIVLWLALRYMQKEFPEFGT